MKAVPPDEVSEKLIGLALRMSGYVITVVFGAGLLLLWILTAPLLHGGIYLSDIYRARFATR
jgi:hypothetical protein